MNPVAPSDTEPQSPLQTTSKRYGWGSRLRSYLFYDPLAGLYTLVFGIASIPAGFFDRDGSILHGFARAWSRLILKTIPAPVTVVGLENIEPSKPAVYAANHASAIDIPLLYAYLPFQFRIIHKKELLSYPIVGWHLKRSGQICIDQKDPASSIGSIRSALKGLKAGMPLVIFPEGGRSPDGVIMPFMAGAFFLAIKAQVEVLPVALVGTYELLPMDTYHVKCRPMEVRFGRPIPTKGLTLRDMDALSAQVQKALGDLYRKPR
jgi:1-acyl-sn-glycerol-3-phosphate acyltransferase